MSIRNLGSNNYRPSQSWVDPEQLLLQELENTPGVNFQQPNNPYAKESPPSADGGGTTSQPSRSETDINEILRSSPQGAEFLLGLGGSGGGRNNAFALAANRADRRVNRNRQRVQDLVKLDPTNPLAALVTFLGAREEHLLNEDLVGIRNAYGKQERLTQGRKKFFEDLKKSGHEDIFKELVNKRFGGDTDKAWMFLKDHPEVLAEEFNRPNPAKIKDYISVLRTYQEIVKDMDFIGTGVMGEEAEGQLKTGMKIIKKWLDRQKALHDGQLPASEEKNLRKHMRKLEELRESVNSAKSKKIKSGNFTPEKANQLRARLQELKNLAENNKKYGGTTPNAVIREITSLQTALEIYDSKNKKVKDRITSKKGDPKLKQMEMEEEVIDRWGKVLGNFNHKSLGWPDSKKIEKINNSIMYWDKHQPKTTIKDGVETTDHTQIPDWASRLLSGDDSNAIEDIKQALMFEIPADGTDQDWATRETTTTATPFQEEVQGVLDSVGLGDKDEKYPYGKKSSPPPLSDAYTGDTSNVVTGGVQTQDFRNKQSQTDSGWGGTDETANIFNDPEYGRTSKYVSPNASENINNATIDLQDVEKKVNEVTTYVKKSSKVIGDKALEGSASITKGTIKAVNKAKEEWDFIKRKTIKKKNELYKKLAQLNKEWKEANKLFGIELSPINISREGLLGESSKMAGEGRPLTEEEANRSMEFGWDRYKDNEYTRTVKYLAPDASPLTPSDKKKQSVSDKLNKKYNEIIKEVEEFVDETKKSISGFRFSSNNMIEEAPKESPKQYSAAEIEAIQNKEREERMGGMGGPDKSGSPEEDNSNFIANLDEDTKFILQTENAPMDARAVGYRLKPKMKDGKKVTKNGKVVMEHRLRDGEKIPVSYGLMQLTPKTAYATDYWKELVKKEKPANEEEKMELLFNPKHSVAISKEFRKKLEDKIRGAVAKKNLAWTEEDIRMAVVTAYNWNGENFGSVIRRAGMDDFKSTLSKWDTIHKKNKENQVPDETWSQIRRYKTLRGWK